MHTCKIFCMILGICNWNQLRAAQDCHRDYLFLITVPNRGINLWIMTKKSFKLIIKEVRLSQVRNSNLEIIFSVICKLTCKIFRRITKIRIWLRRGSSGLRSWKSLLLPPSLTTTVVALSNKIINISKKPKILHPSAALSVPLPTTSKKLVVAFKGLIRIMAIVALALYNFKMAIS